ncbi:hypothetical protein L2E82_15269 [Cichorium intybus]|uniref:Uncharacterized protein n=1 Tax=Cichorium intybus TaxID=13427 RepID=A0ACB9F1Y3_CICIN|nr:hypothetical protein L2E82_15269 [Cichorium intybus]
MQLACSSFWHRRKHLNNFFNFVIVAGKNNGGAPTFPGGWVDKGSSEDMKAQIKFWARAVAFNVYNNNAYNQLCIRTPKRFDKLSRGVKATNPKKYCVRPNTGVILLHSFFTMQAQKEDPPDMICKDKFWLQSAVASPGISPKDITPEMVIM